jgi:uncharacterized membrane protein YgaE (UPF0421/DUF939 family)
MTPAVPTPPQLRSTLQRRIRRVRGELLSIVQTSVAAAAAWGLASLVHPRPFFAPVATVISLGISRGRRTVRAIEIAVGVAVGIGVADLIVFALGSNTFVIALVVFLAMSAALLLGAGTVLVNQAAVSAIIAVATVLPGASPSASRLVDALIGGAVALLVGQVLFPRDPIKGMVRAAGPVVEDLAAALATTARAMREGDEQLAIRALQAARATDDDLSDFYDAVTLARETWSLFRPARRTRERVPAYAEAALQMDYAVRNTRVLIRRAINAIRQGGPTSPELADAVALLGRAVRELGKQLEDLDDAQDTRTLALEAAVKATRAAEDGAGLTTMVIVGQVRSTAIDLLRGSGLSAEEAHAALEAAIERAGVSG